MRSPRPPAAAAIDRGLVVVGDEVATYSIRGDGSIEGSGDDALEGVRPQRVDVVRGAGDRAERRRGREAVDGVVQRRGDARCSDTAANAARVRARAAAFFRCSG
jgi:hypothetical protein